MSVQKEAVHSMHVTLDITQLYQEWLHVTCVLQVGCVVIILIIDAIITIRYKLVFRTTRTPSADIYVCGLTNVVDD